MKKKTLTANDWMAREVKQEHIGKSAVSENREPNRRARKLNNESDKTPFIITLYTQKYKQLNTHAHAQGQINNIQASNKLDTCNAESKQIQVQRRYRQSIPARQFNTQIYLL